MDIVRDNLENADTGIQELLDAANVTAQLIGAELNIPRNIGR